MKYYATAISAYDKNRLQHFGIKGMQWGIRRFQNEDGTLTEEGKRRYTYYDGTQNRMNLRGRLKFGNRSADNYDEFERMRSSAQNAKKVQADLDKKAYEKYTADESLNGKLGTLKKQMDSFDKVSADEKFAILNEVIKAQNAMRGSGDYDKKLYDDLDKFFTENTSKAGEARIKEYESLPKGPERDKKLTQLLLDSMDHGQDSEYADGLIRRMQEKSGDYLSGKYKTEAARKAAEEVDALDKESTRLAKKIRELDRKIFTKESDYYEDGVNIRTKLSNVEADRDSKWEKYCEQVLKDMGMPVNEDTIVAIMSVIIWN